MKSIPQADPSASALDSRNVSLLSLWMERDEELLLLQFASRSELGRVEEN